MRALLPLLLTTLLSANLSHAAGNTAATAASLQQSNEQMAQRIVEATVKWQNSSTPPAQASVQLIKKGIVKGKTMFDYRVKVTGAPEDKLYRLMVWPVTAPDPITMMDGLKVSSDGTVICPADSTKSCAQRFKGNELHLTYLPAPGEIYRQALISEDRNARVFFSVVPEPIAGQDRKCSLEVLRLSPNFELVAVLGKGFQPGESLKFHTQSYDEAHDASVAADARGEFHASLTPFVSGHPSGTALVSTQGASCAPKVSFTWGTKPAATKPATKKAPAKKK
jgi:hypothetical protein